MINIKYLEIGLAFIAADSVYGSIGIQMRKAQEVHTFDDFVGLVDKSAKHVKPVVMQVSEFYDFKPGNRSPSLSLPPIITPPPIRLPTNYLRDTRSLTHTLPHNPG